MVSLAAMLGSDRARATEMPPRRPPHVSTGMAPLVKVRLSPSTVSGVATLMKRAAITTGTAAAMTSAICPVIARAMTSKPMIRNSTAFRISSISDQNL